MIHLSFMIQEPIVTAAFCSMKMNGCGQTLHTHSTAGVSHHTSNPLLLYLKTKHLIIIYPGCVYFPSLQNSSDIFKQVHVKSEHAMGYLKGCFSSLWGLRQQIGDANDHKGALVWVKTCIVIHTLISFIEEGDEDNNFIDELVREGTDIAVIRVGEAAEEHSDTHREREGQRKCTELKTKLFESIYAWHVVFYGWTC